MWKKGLPLPELLTRVNIVEPRGMVRHFCDQLVVPLMRLIGLTDALMTIFVDESDLLGSPVVWLGILVTGLTDKTE